MRKQVCAILSVLLLVTGANLFAGGNQEMTTEDEKVSLRVLTPFDVEAIGEEYVTALSQAADELGYDVTIENINGETFKTRIKVALAGNELPDVFFTWGDSWTVPFIEAGALYPMNDAIEASGLNYYPSYIKPYDDGNIYTAPYTSNDFYGIFYNKKALNELGVAPPSDWEELVDLCRAAQANPDIAAIGLGNGGRWQGDLFYNMLVLREDPMAFEKANSGEISWESEPFIEAARKVDQLLKLDAFQKGYMTASNPEANELFFAGKIALRPHGTWTFATAIANMGDEFGYIPFPKTGKDQNYLEASTCMFGSLPNGLCVSAESKYPDQAVEFAIKYSELINEAIIKKGRMGFIDSDVKPEVDIHPEYAAFMQSAKNISTIQPFWFGVLPASIGEPMRDLSHEQFGDQLTPEQFVAKLSEVMTE